MTFLCSKCKKKIPYLEEIVLKAPWDRPRIDKIYPLQWYNESSRRFGGRFLTEHPKEGYVFYHLDCYTKDQYINEERTRIYIARILNKFIDPLNLKEKELNSYQINIDSIRIKSLLKELFLICRKFKVNLKQKKKQEKKDNKLTLEQRYLKKVGRAHYFHIPETFLKKKKLFENRPYIIDIFPQKRL